MTTVHIYPGSKVEVTNVTPGKRILAIGRHSGGVTEIVTPQDIAVAVANYNVEHVSEKNRAWAEKRLQEELVKEWIENDEYQEGEWVGDEGDR